ncbi:hypothetical protein GBA52_023211 [Prunus armeniaca]|nr:hypothetical protein GBA52_023211 [Prunus armeniaca]
MRVATLIERQQKMQMISLLKSLQSKKKNKKGSQGKGKKGDKENQDTDREAEASRNELELLLADDKGADTGLKGYNLKRKKTKGKKGKEVQEEDNIPAVDYEDPRFSALFMSPVLLWIQQIHSSKGIYLLSAAYARQLALRQQKGDQEEVVEREVKSDVLWSKIEKSSLIRSIKMKANPLMVRCQRKKKICHPKGERKKER